MRVGDQALQVRALQHAADEDVDRRERVAVADGLDAARNAHSIAAGAPQTTSIAESSFPSRHALGLSLISTAISVSP